QLIGHRVVLGAGVGRALRQRWNPRSRSGGGLHEQAVVAGEGHHLAIHIQRVFAEHLPLAQAAAQIDLLGEVVDEIAVGTHGRACGGGYGDDARRCRPLHLPVWRSGAGDTRLETVRAPCGARLVFHAVTGRPISSGSGPACTGLRPARRGSRPVRWSGWSASRRSFPGAGAPLPRPAAWAGGRRVCSRRPGWPTGRAALGAGWRTSSTSRSTGGGWRSAG